MTGALGPDADSSALVQPFPKPGRLVQLAYRELDLATSRQQDHLPPLQDLATLSRRWDSGTCQTPQLRREVWLWLDERVRSRLRNHCQEDHQSWPAKGRYTRHIGEATCRRRMDAYAADVRALKSTYDQDQSPRLGLVDLATDEIKQLSDFDSHVYGRDKINA